MADWLDVLVVGDRLLDLYLPLMGVKTCQEGAPVMREMACTYHLAGGAAAVADMLRELGTECALACGAASVKQRYVLDDRVLLRIDQDSHTEPEEALRIVREAVAGRRVGHVVASDYGKGMVTREVMCVLREAAETLYVDPYPGVSPRVYDGADVIMPNDETYWLRFGEWYGFQVVVRKLGAGGATLVQAGRDAIHLPAPAVPVVDSCGAGDQFLAALVHFASRGVPLEESVSIAVLAGAANCRHRGARPATLQEIEELQRCG